MLIPSRAVRRPQLQLPAGAAPSPHFLVRFLRPGPQPRLDVRLPARLVVWEMQTDIVLHCEPCSATSSSDSIVEPITNYIDGEIDALLNRVDPTVLTFRGGMQACAPPRPARSLTSAMHPASSLRVALRISSLDPSSPPHSTSSSTTLAVFDRCCAPSILATTPTVSLRSLVLLR